MRSPISREESNSWTYIPFTSRQEFELTLQGRVLFLQMLQSVLVRHRVFQGSPDKVIELTGYVRKVSKADPSGLLLRELDAFLGCRSERGHFLVKQPLILCTLRPDSGQFFREQLGCSVHPVVVSLLPADRCIDQTYPPNPASI
jgi:hypothetical protein